jgi:hypothetical protein
MYFLATKAVAVVEYLQNRICLRVCSDSKHPGHRRRVRVYPYRATFLRLAGVGGAVIDPVSFNSLENLV